MTRIKYARMSPELEWSKSSYFWDRWGLNHYSQSNHSDPAIFFGIYKCDLRRLIKHDRSVPSIIIWAGTDILMSNHLKKVLEIPLTNHVAIGNFIASDLKKAGIKYKLLPIDFRSNNDIKKAYPLGDEIYTYIPSTRKEFYNLKLIKWLRKRTKYKINVTASNNQFNRKKMLKLYKRCFLNLRLTPHDGLPNTVMEMALMGRKSVYNGGLPGSICWDSNHPEEILETIEKEASKIIKQMQPKDKNGFSN